jgi:hypothetical protein
MWYAIFLGALDPSNGKVYRLHVWVEVTTKASRRQRPHTDESRLLKKKGQYREKTITF